MLKSDYLLGQYVYVLHDPNQQPYMITCIRHYADHITYDLSRGDEVNEFFAYELSKTKNPELL